MKISDILFMQDDSNPYRCRRCVKPTDRITTPHHYDRNAHINRRLLHRDQLNLKIAQLSACVSSSVALLDQAFKFTHHVT